MLSIQLIYEANIEQQKEKIQITLSHSFLD